MNETGETLPDDAVLGPFQPMWDAWDEADEAIRAKPLSHFRKAVEIQFDELESHLERRDKTGASREAADVVSIAFNVMRWMGYTSREVATVVRDRAEHRMKGQTFGILEKYERVHRI